MDGIPQLIIVDGFFGKRLVHHSHQVVKMARLAIGCTTTVGGKQLMEQKNLLQKGLFGHGRDNINVCDGGVYRGIFAYQRLYFGLGGRLEQRA